jgi:pyruvate kinase
MLSFEDGRAALDRNTDALLGSRPSRRVPRVIVTLPSEAADDYPLVRHLVARGMDVARINGSGSTTGPFSPTQAGSGASQGTVADRQWVISSDWSLR